MYDGCMGASFGDVNCPIARTLDVIGDRWTPLILRDIAVGVTRFDVLQRNTGVSRKVLTQRLGELVDGGLLERTAYQDNPPRYDYTLTEKGADLAPVLIAMKRWGDRWILGEDNAPLVFRHEACGTIGDPVSVCPGCGEPVHGAELTPLPGPGFAPGPGTSETGAILAQRIPSAS